MTFLILSDTHGRIDRAGELIERLHEQIDGVWHLGDNYRDFELLEKRYRPLYHLAFQAVPGNCDSFCPAPNRLSIPVEGHRVFMQHGDAFGVSGYSIGQFPRAAKREKANVVLFGHTHVPLIEVQDGVLYLNPGSLSLPKGGSEPSYALLDLERNQPPKAELFTYSE
ncbi:MAG: metallophosphoesterase family protein [Firmicutes bacterium]|nr:metallophosphoesterase family protein [Bacillota bacterium]